MTVSISLSDRRGDDVPVMNDRTSPCHDPHWDVAWTWVQRQHEAGFANAAFNAALNQWLQADPAHRRAYDQATRLWAIAGLVPPVNNLSPPRCSDPTSE